jgi:hypothetical protein
MLSESARMTTAEEARYRIDYPNSKPRATKIIALDPPSEAVVKRLAQGKWQQASFFTSVDFDGAPRSGENWSMKAWLSDLAGRTKDLIDEVSSADLVVMVASAGTKPKTAGVIAEACGVRKVMTTALIIGSDASSDEELSRTLAALRPYAGMLVIASDDDYIEQMLVALRA